MLIGIISTEKVRYNCSTPWKKLVRVIAMERTESKTESWIHRFEQSDDTSNDQRKETANMSESDFRILLMEIEHR